jgi:hypothetical protein
MHWLRTIARVGILWAIAAGACAFPAMRSGQIIESYKSARCVQPTIAQGVSPPTRGWNADWSLPSGTRISVRGKQMAGGRVTVQYLSDGAEVVAADAGDYVYPADVRINESGTILVVKAEGLAAGIWPETWLFEYSLDARRLLSKHRVAPEVLPAECVLQER